jgi:hypothetical protein
MPFKLINKPVIYQRFINDVLFDYLNDFYIVYLNDIFIYLKNKLDY